MQDLQRELQELDTKIAELESKLKPFFEELQALKRQRELLYSQIRKQQRLEEAKARAKRRQEISSGNAITLQDLVEQAAMADHPQELPWSKFTMFLKTGGEVELGYATAKAAYIEMSNGILVEKVYTLDQAAKLWLGGYEFGRPGKRAVRVHMKGSKLERLVAPEDVYVKQEQSNRETEFGAHLLS
jgi:predicted RNase H-like nuclease (RuvC/YqgF family)